MNFANTTVLVTGGGRGIGRHLVQRLFEEGARVCVLELDPKLVEELNNLGISSWQCDVSDADTVDTTIRQIFASGFLPQVLVNNAGVIHNEPLVNLLTKDDKAHSRQSWKRVIACDLDSVFYVTSRFVERLVSHRLKGTVVSISSISARGNAGQTAYSAAKAGVIALTSTWAKELGPLGFRFAAISPGFLDTQSTQAALSQGIQERLKNQIPLRRFGNAEHVYLALRYIIENDYVNGTALEVDGGLIL
jgi:3-oxoacyl-[acyl-carrier protein] reductase